MFCVRLAFVCVRECQYGLFARAEMSHPTLRGGLGVFRYARGSLGRRSLPVTRGSRPLRGAAVRYGGHVVCYAVAPGGSEPRLA